MGPSQTRAVATKLSNRQIFQVKATNLMDLGLPPDHPVAKEATVIWTRILAHEPRTLAYTDFHLKLSLPILMKSKDRTRLELEASFLEVTLRSATMQRLELGR